MNSIALKKVTGHDNFQLKENGKTVLEISYNPEMHTARVRSNEARRVLIIEDESFFKVKMSIKNEYGIRIGTLAWDNFSNTHGAIDIEGAKFRFVISYEQTPHVEIYKGKKSVYDCQLSFSAADHKVVRYESSSSVIAVSWYLFLKMATATKKATASVA